MWVPLPAAGTTENYGAIRSEQSMNAKVSSSTTQLEEILRAKKRSLFIPTGTNVPAARYFYPNRRTHTPTQLQVQYISQSLG